MGKLTKDCRECNGSGWLWVMPEHSSQPRQVRCHKCDGTGVAAWTSPEPMRRTAPALPTKDPDNGNS